MGQPDRELQASMPVGSMARESPSRRSKLFFLRETVGKRPGHLRLPRPSPPRRRDAPAHEQLRGPEAPHRALDGRPRADPHHRRPRSAPAASRWSPRTRRTPRRPHPHPRRAQRRRRVERRPARSRPRPWSTSSTPRPTRKNATASATLIAENDVDLLTSGIAADKVAAQDTIAPQFVEAELKSYAKDKPGPARQAARRPHRPVPRGPVRPRRRSARQERRFRHAVPRTRQIPVRQEGNDEKKIAFLSERRAPVPAARPHLRRHRQARSSRSPSSASSSRTRPAPSPNAA